MEGEAMRKSLAILALSLGLAVPASAQSPAASFWTGANPRQINFKAIDVTQFNRPGNVSAAFRRPSPTRGFVLSRMFPKINIPGWPPKIGSPASSSPLVTSTSPIIGTANSPTTSGPIIGGNLFGKR
jgi:hypothetical protein